MTCIIWYKDKIYADCMTSWWIKWITNDNKIIKLPHEKWDSLIWTSWNYIPTDFILEMYNKWELKDQWLFTYANIFDFINFIKKEIWVKDIIIDFMIINNTFQIMKYNHSTVDTLDDDWFIVMWSWWEYASTLLRACNLLWINIPIEDIYKVVSKIDNKTSSNFNCLSL